MMDLNDLKERTQQFKVPEDYLIISKEKEEMINNFIEKLKIEDANERKKIKTSMVFYIIAAVIFGIAFLISVFTIIHADSAGMGNFRGALSLCLWFIVFLSFKKINQLKKIVYDEPIKTFLDKAEKRYQFYGMESWIISTVGLLALYLAAMIFVVPYLQVIFSIEAKLTMLLLFTLFYIGICIAGFYFTYKDWERGKKSFWLNIKKMKQELDAPEVI